MNEKVYQDADVNGNEKIGVEDVTFNRDKWCSLSYGMDSGNIKIRVLYHVLK